MTRRNTFAYNPVGQLATVGKSNDLFTWAGAANVVHPYF